MMKARTEFTPRAYPSFSNIRTLMSDEMVAGIAPASKSFYEPPDKFNPDLHPPKGQIDVLSIVEAGVDFQSTLNPDYSNFYIRPTFHRDSNNNPSTIEVGKGIQLNTKAADHLCDGSVDSWCGRGPSNTCLLYGHNDGRNGMKFDGYSGWIVFTIPNLKYGYITIKYESWHRPEKNKLTAGWKSINNERRRERRQLHHMYNNNETQLNSRRNDTKPTPSVGPIMLMNTTMTKTKSDIRIHQEENGTSIVTMTPRTATRRLKTKPPPFCKEFVFEYSIDGKITTLNLSQWNKRNHKIQRVVETLTLLNDPSYTNGIEQEVEVAVRIRGCGRLKTFNLNHIYWS